MNKSSQATWQYPTGRIALVCALAITIVVTFASARACLPEFTILGFVRSGIGLVLIYFPYISIVSAFAAISAAWPRKTNHWPVDAGVIFVTLGSAGLISANINFSWLALPLLMIPLGCLIRSLPIDPRILIMVSLVIGIIAGGLIFAHAHGATPCVP
jgi:hypothetical protein